MSPWYSIFNVKYNGLLTSYSVLTIYSGDGSYGFVASALDTKTGNKVAIKKIKNAFSDLIDAKRILREIKLLRQFNSHENIVTILGIQII